MDEEKKSSLLKGFYMFGAYNRIHYIDSNGSRQIGVGKTRTECAKIVKELNEVR